MFVPPVVETTVAGIPDRLCKHCKTPIANSDSEYPACPTCGNRTCQNCRIVPDGGPAQDDGRVKDGIPHPPSILTNRPTAKELLDGLR